MEEVILKQDNLQTIMSAAPQSYRDNKLSREKCIEVGTRLLSAIQAEGMTDELDQQAATFLEKARKTVKKMNERRSPVTKLFDDIRKEFTAMENAIDPTKADTVPYQIQQLRNQYAAKKRAEEEERRRIEYARKQMRIDIEYARQQAEIARKQMRIDIEDDLNRQFSAYLNNINNTLSEIDSKVTLENYEVSLIRIQMTPTVLPQGYFENLHTCIRIPGSISIDEFRTAEAEVKESLKCKFCDQYAFEIEGTKQYILDRMPSRRTALERLAQSSAEEAARIQQEMESRQRREAQMREEERRRKEEEERQQAELARQQAELARQQAEMDSLFAAQASVQGYQPNVKVAQKINILSPEGVMLLVSMWWSKEGCTLSIEELQKIFKKQITFCEKLAKEGVLINDASIEYVEDIKAK